MRNQKRVGPVISTYLDPNNRAVTDATNLNVAADTAG